MCRNPLRLGMARRRTKKRAPRRRRGISILGASEALLMGSAIFRGLFNNTISGFFMPSTMSSNVAYASESSIGSGGWGYGNVVTLNEFWGAGQQSTASAPVSQQIQANLQANWMTMVGSMIVIPLAFRVGKRLAAPAINQTNRLLRDVGVASVVKI